MHMDFLALTLSWRLDFFRFYFAFQGTEGNAGDVGPQGKRGIRVSVHIALSLPHSTELRPFQVG